MDVEALKQMTTARGILLLDHGFWGQLAMKLKLVEEPQCETAATDGEVLLFNPDYCSSLSDLARVGLMAHEVMHPAMGDIWRIDGRDSFIWNMACDYVNNGMLVKPDKNAGFNGFTLPEGALLNPAYDGMSKEDVYAILIKLKGKDGKQGGQPGGNGKQGQGTPQQGQSGQDKFKDPGKCGSMFKPADSAKAADSKIDWKTATIAAENSCRGDLPGGLRKTIMDDVIDPPLPWHMLLQDFIQRTSRNDYNWSRPNRRYLSQGLYMPGLLSEELPHTVVAIDSSYSTEEYQPRFASEASGVLSSFKTHITLIYSDAMVQSVKEYETEDLPLVIEAKGYGGTDFRPVFDYVEKQGITPACLIYLTDLDGPFPKVQPEYPVLWVSCNKWNKEKKAPWGETIPITIV